MKITIRQTEFCVHGFEGSIFLKLFRALINFYYSLFIDSYWNGIQKGRIEKETYEIMDRFLDKKHSMVDIGAWVGTETLYGCQKAKHCFSVEPDPVSSAQLSANILLNPHLAKKITVYKGAIGPTSGTVQFSNRFRFGLTISTSIETHSGNVIQTDCLSFNDFVRKYKIHNCNFVKIDTEGAEVTIIPGMQTFIRKYHPTIHLSLHPKHFPDLKQNSESILSVIAGFPYIYSNNGKELSVDKIRQKLYDTIRFDIVCSYQKW